MIDLHSHLLPGVDDGSRSVDVSVGVLRRFAEQGVSAVACTPHLDASAVATAPWREHRDLRERLQSAAPGLPTLLPGWEIMLDVPGMDFSAPHLGIAESRAILVEFRRGGIPPGGSAELVRIARTGRLPVLAHPERYFGCTLEAVREWRAAGVVIQTDVSVLLGKGVPAQFARAMLAEGCIDLLASDNHGDRRSLAAGREWLEAQGAGAERIELLTRTNPQRIVGGQAPAPVAPLRPSLGARLRALLGR